MVRFNKKSVYRGLGFSLLFVVSYIFFVYWTFPYGVVKEAIAAKISQESGFTIVADKLSPRFPIGLKLTDIDLSVPGSDASLHVASFSFRLSVLRLLLGQVAASVDLTAKGGAYFSAWTTIGVWQLVGSNNPLPSHIIIDADRFPIEDWVDFALASSVKSGAVPPHLSQIVINTKLSGQLSADVDVKLDPSELTMSRGKADIQLLNSSLALNDPGLDISEQFFERSKIFAEIKDGQLVLGEDSGFQSEELTFDVNGSIDLQPDFMQSQLKIVLLLQLRGKLKNNFSFIVDPLLGGRDGQSRIQFLGPIARPSQSPI